QARGNALGLEQAEGDLRFDRIRIGGDGGEHGRGLRYAAAMRTAILALAVLGLAAGCGGEAPQPAASAPAPADPAHERVAQDWPLPATMPGSAMPDLVSVGGSRLLLSWIHSPPGRRPALQFSSYDPAGLRWETAPVTIAVGASMVVNWADTPHIQASHDGALWVHWLQKTGASPHAY